MKHDEVRRIIRFRIASGEYPPGEAIPAERTLAELFQVSRVTVRGALQPLIESGLLKRCGRGGTVVCRRPELKLAGKKKKQVLFVYFSSIPGTKIASEGASAELVRGMENFFMDRDFSVILQSGENFLQEKLPGNICGIVAGGTDLDRHLPELAASGVPVVATVTSMDLSCDAVGWDDFSAGSCAAVRAYERGAKKVLTVVVQYEGENFLQSSFRRRIAGFADGICGKNIGNEVLTIPHRMCLDKSALKAFITREMSERQCDFLIDCSSLPPSVYDDFPAVAIDTLYPEVNELREIIFHDIRHVGYLAAERLLQKIKNPCLENIHILLPVKVLKGKSAKKKI